jgi:hypothetical protein
VRNLRPLMDALQGEEMARDRAHDQRHERLEARVTELENRVGQVEAYLGREVADMHNEVRATVDSLRRIEEAQRAMGRAIDTLVSTAAAMGRPPGSA